MGRRPVLAVVVVLLVTLQVAVPLTALVLPDKPHRLGWQMYSAISRGDLTVNSANGDMVDVPWSDVLPRVRRPDIDWTRHLPEALCAHVDEPSLTVRVGDETRTVTC